MKRKVFSLMLMLLIAVTGISKANEVTVYDGTTTNNYVPVYGTWADAYLKAEFIVPAAELMPVVNGDVNTMKFYLSSPATAAWTGTFQVFMKVVDFATFPTTAYVGPDGATVVYEGTLDATSPTMTVNFTTPFHYDGGNLLIGFYQIEKGNYKGAYFYGQTVNGASLQGYNSSSLASVSCYQRNFIPKTTFVYEGGTVIIPGLAVDPDPVDLGYRPIGAWMRPFDVELTTTGEPEAIVGIETTEDFFVVDAELPALISRTQPFDFTITHGEAAAGAINGNIAVWTEDRKAYIFDILAQAYEPVANDVFETATTPITFPFSATVGADIYDNYLLPGTNHDGKDVIYKMNITGDVLLNAEVTGTDGKIAVYTEDFNGEPGPGVDNNYDGPQISAGSDPFDVVIGDESNTTTTGYFPFYTLYNYSIAEHLFLASELEEAGVNTTPMASLSWDATNTTGYEQSNISIWMANVTESALTTTSHITSGMTLVYTGSVTPLVGWNEFVFNQGEFAWDGVSNILICVQRNNGAWNSTVNWRTHSIDFYGHAHAHTDDAPYDVTTTTYTLSTTTARANTKFKSVGSRMVADVPAIENMTLVPGVYYLAASSTDDEFTVTATTDALPLPEQAYNPSPMDGGTGVSTPTALTWTFGNYTTGYRLLLGTTYPPTNVVVDWTNELSNRYTVTNLYNNKNYFWRVDEMNSTGVTTGQVWGFTTTLNVPQGLTAEEEKIYEGDVLRLTWTPVADRSYRGYNIYQDGVKINTSVIDGIEYEVSGLTYNMDGYTFNVTAVYDEGESDFSSDLVAYVTGNGTINGYALEVDGTTGIANATITFNGTDEYMRPATFTFTTNASGAYSGNVLAGNYTGMASIEGYQSMPYSGTIHVTYNETTSNINFILYENWYPVAEVIAEEMEGNNEVNVYWSMSIMSEILEDFETGDFTAYPWVNDPTYPWTITTTSPYEGTYCMKSGGAGVASVTSAIEVTMEANRDALMSFYGKISSENNWDYGYFYIDGTEKASFTGAGSWTLKEFPITAGTHTYRWAYTKDGSVNSNDDCFYVDYVSFIHDAAPVIPVVGDSYDFETGMQGWTVIDADGDGFGWELGSSMMGTGYGHGGSNDLVLSQSYDNTYGVLYPDNYLVSPAVTLGGQITFYACAQDNAYAAEHFGVAVSTTTGSSASAFTTIQEWTMSAKEVGAICPVTRSGNRTQGNWYQYTVDLSAYSGTGYVAIRHFNCSDMFYLDVDDVVIGTATKGNETVERAPQAYVNTNRNASMSPVVNRSFQNYNVYRADVDENNVELLISTTDTNYIDNAWAGLAPGIYKWGVSRVYEGNRANRATLTYDFEDLSFQGWTSIDADGDGYDWMLSSNAMGTGYGHNGSTDMVFSQSYNNDVGILYPDNYLVSPAIALGGTISFYACAQDNGYAGEHFGVAVSTTSGTSASAFTTIQEWTMTAKGAGTPCPVTRSGNRTQGNWYLYTVDLSAYSGTGYVAIRHFNCYDMFYLDVDDITIVEGGALPPTPPTPPTPGATGGESEIVWSEPIEHNMFTNVNVVVNTNSGDAPTGAVVTLANVNEPGYSYNTTLEESGTYSWDNFRRGTYNVTVELAGFTPVAETVDIWNPTTLTYTLEEIVAEIESLYVSATGWAIFGEMTSPTPVVPPTTGWEEGFESGMPEGWTVLDANNDGYTWCMTSAIPSTWTYYASLTLDWYRTGSNAICSGSYINGVGAITPDEYLITPQLAPAAGTTFSFWAAATDASYPADHFGVAVSTTGTAASDFTMLQEWTLTAKEGGMNGGRASRDGNGAKLGNWYQYSVDLSAYAGQSIYVAIRHFNCNDQYIMCVDDIAFGSGSKNIQYYNVKLDDVLVGTTEHPFYQFDEAGLVAGETYTAAVQAVYGTGSTDWATCDFVYTPCDEFAGLEEDPTAVWNGDDIVLNWVLPGGTGPTPPPTPTTVYDFETGLQGWTAIDADGDGFGWELGSSMMGTGYGHNASSDLVLSQSYDNTYGVLYPDNYIVSPEITLGSSITFYACAQDNAYAAEHFGVAVSTTSNTSASAFTTIQEWTMTAKEVGAPCPVTRSGNRTQGNWYEYTVDLSSYSGQGYVAIRHFNCSDMFYLDVDDITIGGGSGPTPPPTPPTPPTGDTYDFETGMQGWTAIDADGDGFGWELGSSMMGTGYGHGGSSDLVLSQSYDNTYGVLYPDNYLVSPAITLGGAISFYACAQDNAYAAEHFGVAVSTTSGTSASAFTTIQEWTMTAKEVGAPCPVTRSGNRTQGNWYQYTVDLSAYSGTGYVAIRHFNCSDMFYLDVDDITIGSTKGGRAMWDYVASFTGTSAGQQGVATDGTYIYTASWQSAPTGGYTFYKYDLTGNFIEGFDIAGATGIRDLTTDGQYFYGTSGGAQIFILDFTTKTLVGTINCSGLTSRHISYDPVRDGFWSGNWSDLALYSRTGALIQNGPAPTSAYGSGYFVDENDEEHLLLFCQPNSDAKVYDYNITTNTLGSSPVFDFAVTPGFDGIAGGCFIANYDDKLCWFGNCQQDPNLIGIYELAAASGPTPPTPPTPVPGEGVIGVEIFRDGEWIAEVPATSQTYTDVAPGEVGEYEIRVVWNGDVADYTYYAMSCPQIAIPGEPITVCDAPENLEGDYEWHLDGTYGARINWTYGEAPIEPTWYYYDNGVNVDAIGLNGGGSFSWAVMFPAGTYTGNAVIEVAAFDYSAMNGSLTIYQGGTTEPGTAVGTMNITFSGIGDFVEFVFPSPVTIDPTQNLWIVLNNIDGGYVAACCDDTGDPNGRWIYLEGYGWMDLLNDAGLPYTWMVRALVGESSKTEVTPIEVVTYNESGTLATAGVAKGEANLDFMVLDDPASFNVYRDGSVIGNVPFTGEYEYTYFDDAAIGTYEYQVTAVYDNGCESDFALTPNLSQNYVSVHVTSVGEENNNISLYPNPTKGNVRIEANGMNHITVVSVLGQVVYDADVNADQMELNLGQFKAGVYTIRISTENGVDVKRVTVVK